MKRTRPLLTLFCDLGLVALFVAATLWFFLTDGLRISNPAAEFFKYFTIQSNALLALLALVLIPFDILILLGKVTAKPKPFRIALLAMTTGTTITMLVATFFLAPTLGAPLIFGTYNSILHVIAPLLGITRVIFLDDEKEKGRFYYAFFGMIHMGIYGIVYLANVIVHDGYGQAQYDWYGFGANGLGIGLLSFFIIFGLAFGVCFGLLVLQNLFIKRLTSKE